jgi:uncharacterized protein (TIGR04255 family)
MDSGSKTHAFPDPDMTDDRLPSFKKPPVIETVLGVQFEPIAKFTNAHLGVFWKRLAGDWTPADAPPLEPVFERFGEEEVWSREGLQLKVSQVPQLRLRIKNAAADRMIQLQNGRLHYNWLGQPGAEYPRYSMVRPEFDKYLRKLEGSLAKESLGELCPTQWEVTYVNDFPKGTVWNNPTDWAELFSALPGPFGKTPPATLESFGGEWHYEIEPQRGRLHVRLQHGRRSPPDTGEVMKMILTARGPVRVQEGAGLDEGLDLGHETIVRAFRDLTSQKAHDFWGLYYDSA